MASCPPRLGTTAETWTPRFTSSRPIIRVALPKPPYFPQANISTQIKQTCIIGYIDFNLLEIVSASSINPPVKLRNSVRQNRSKENARATSGLISNADIMIKKLTFGMLIPPANVRGVSEASKKTDLIQPRLAIEISIPTERAMNIYEIRLTRSDKISAPTSVDNSLSVKSA